MGDASPFWTLGSVSDKTQATYPLGPCETHLHIRLKFSAQWEESNDGTKSCGKSSRHHRGGQPDWYGTLDGHGNGASERACRLATARRISQAPQVESITWSRQKLAIGGTCIAFTSRRRLISNASRKVSFSPAHPGPGCAGRHHARSGGPGRVGDYETLHDPSARVVSDDHPQRRCGHA